MREDYKQAALTLSQPRKRGQAILRPAITLATVNTWHEDNKHLIETYGIIGYPNFRYFRKGFAYDWEGKRKSDEIVDALVKLFHPSMSFFGDNNEAETWGKSHDVVVIGYFAHQDSENFKVTSTRLIA